MHCDAITETGALFFTVVVVMFNGFQEMSIAKLPVFQRQTGKGTSSFILRGYVSLISHLKYFIVGVMYQCRRIDCAVFGK